MKEEQLVAALKQLPRAVEPPRDFWSDVDSSLDQRLATSWPLMALAAALVAAVALAFVMRQPQGDSMSVSPDAAVASDASERSAAGLQYASFLDAEYAGALREIRRAGKSQPAPEPAADAGNPEKDAELRAAFADIAAAQRRLRERLEKDPDNLQLASLLALTHRQQARSLRAVTTTEISS